MLNCCPICYQVEIGHGSKNSRKLISALATQQKFFGLFERYLNANGRDTSIKVGDFPLEQVSQLGMISCWRCLNIMESFCHAYKIMKNAEAIINWKVETVKCLLESNSESGGSTILKYVRECIDKLDVEESYKKGATKVVDSFVQSRESLIFKCSQKLANSFPKISIARLNTRGSRQAARKRTIVTNHGNSKKIRCDDEDSCDQKLLRMERVKGNKTPVNVEFNENENLKLNGIANLEHSATTSKSNVSSNNKTKTVEDGPNITNIIIGQPEQTPNVSSNQVPASIENLPVALEDGEIIEDGECLAKSKSHYKGRAIQVLRDRSSRTSQRDTKRRHTSNRSSSPIYICSCRQCQRKFTSVYSFQSHFRAKHSIKPFKSDRSRSKSSSFKYSSSSSSTSRKPHRSPSEFGESYKCPVFKCKEYFSHHHQVYRHYRRMHLGIRFECYNCNQIFENDKSFTFHKICCPMNIISCRKCKEGFCSYQDFSTHFRNAHNSQPDKRRHAGYRGMY